MDAKKLQTPGFTTRKAPAREQTFRHASYMGCTDTPHAVRLRARRAYALATVAIGAIVLLGAATSQAAWLHWTNPKYNSAVDDSGNPMCALDTSNPLRDLATIRVYGVSIRGGPSRVFASLSVRGREGLGDSIQVDPGPGAHLWLTAVDVSGNECCVSQQVYIGPITAVPVEAAPAERVTSYRVFDARGRLVHPVAAGVYFWERRYSSGRVESGKMVRVK